MPHEMHEQTRLNSSRPCQGWRLETHRPKEHKTWFPIFPRFDATELPDTNTKKPQPCTHFREKNGIHHFWKCQCLLNIDLSYAHEFSSPVLYKVLRKKMAMMPFRAGLKVKIPLYFGSNFAKSQPIFEILLLLEEHAICTNRV